MRRVIDQSQTQIVLNQLNNAQAKFNTKALDRKGTQVKNIGDATDPQDAVALGQVSGLVQSGIQQTVPRSVAVPVCYTIVWTTPNGLASVQDVFPPYCIVGTQRVGLPLVVWLAAGVAPINGNGLSIQLNLNGVPLLNNGLTLPRGQKGPVQSSNFVITPNFGIGAFLQPSVQVAGNHMSISIGVVVQTSVNQNITGVGVTGK